jgi:hypothetical protein
MGLSGIGLRLRKNVQGLDFNTLESEGIDAHLSMSMSRFDGLHTRMTSRQ